MARTLISWLLGLGVAQAPQSAVQTQQTSLELLDAASKGDKFALQELRARAEQGLADAQYNLGTRYYTGAGVPRDPAQAVQWIRKAAEQGDATAQSELGLMYYNGEGVLKDLV